MKKIFYILFIIAVSAITFSSCQKEKAILPNGKLVTVSFTAEKAGSDTRTAANEGESKVTYIWTDEDIANIKLFSITTETTTNEQEEEIVTEVVTEISSPIITKVSDTQLTISAEVEGNKTYTFRAILCDPASYTGSGSNYGSRKPKTKASQSPDGISNFDPTADILISDDKVVTVGEDDSDTGDMLLTFNRKVVINKMTLKNIGAGEKVSKVVITGTKDILGYWKGDSMSGQSDVITLNYNNVEPSEGLFPVYFVSMPQTGVSLTVDVTTDQNTYSKSFAEGRSIDLNLGQFTKFNVALPAGTPVSTIADGDYFITAINSTTVYAAKAYTSGNHLGSPLTINLDAENETIEYKQDIEDCIFTFTRLTEGSYAGKYTIQDANGLYLYAASSSGNQLKGESEPDANGNAYWTVEKDANGGTYTIQAAGANTHNNMRFNYNNGTPIFNCYESGQTAVTIYPASWCTLDTTPLMTIDSEERTKEVLSAATSVVFNYTANRYASVPTVTVSSDADGIIAENDGEAAITVADGKITVGLVANTEDKVKTATLSVTSTGLASVVTLTITQAAYVNLVSGNESFNLAIKSYTTGTNAVTWDGTSTTIHNSGTNATNYLGGDSNNRTSSRFYNGNSLTITPKSGYTITSVVFTATSDNYATVLGNSTWSNGTSSTSGSTVTVTPTNGTETISATVGGTCGFTKIVVNYLTAGSGDSGSGESGTVTYSTFTYNSSAKTVSGGDSVISILQEKGTSTNDVGNYTSPIRFYAGHTLTISAASGYTITSIVFGMNGSYNLSKVSSDSGTIEDLTWTGSSSSVVFTTTAQTRINSITVTYN